MTLAEWREKYPKATVQDKPGNAAYAIMYYAAREAHAEVFHLSDYKVSSVLSGNAVWLVPVKA